MVTMPRLEQRPSLRRWAIPGALAVAILWGISFLFVDDASFYTWDDTLQTCVRPPRQTMHWRSEGWATTRFGEHGIPAIPDVERLPGPKAIIWGDSYVEALQVSDERKMPQQASRIWRSSHQEPLTFVGLGRAGAAAVDSYFRIPKYEKIITPITAHFIIINDIRQDLLPGTEEPVNTLLITNSLFLAEPSYHFEEREIMPTGQSAKKWIDTLHLNAFISIAKSIAPAIPGLGAKTSWRFNVGPQDNVLHEKSDTTETPNAAPFAYLLSEFKKIQKAPIIFVYLPDVPTIKNGAIKFSDDDSQYANLFADECAKQGFTFLSMGDEFIRFFKEKAAFPRGFPNTYPGEGHINADGHRLVAEAICKHMETL